MEHPLRKRIDSGKNWIAAIDVGYRNIGLAVFKPDEDTMEKFPYIEHSSLYMDSQGIGCHTWEENQSTERVYNWVLDRWKDIFSNCAFVILEKQMLPNVDVNKLNSMGSIQQCRNFTFRKINEIKNSRHCLIVQNQLEMLFHQQTVHGGPYYITVGPTWWKNTHSVAYGKKNSRGSSHKINKQNSVAMMTKLLGREEIKRISKIWPKIDDVCDATFMCWAAYKRQEELIKKFSISNHTLDVFNEKKVIVRADRLKPLRALNNPPPIIIPVEKRDAILRQAIAKRKRKQFQ